MDADASTQEYIRLFAVFLEADEPDGCINRVNKLMTNREKRLLINLNALRRSNIDLCNRLLDSPSEQLGNLEAALEQVITGIDPDYFADEDKVAPAAVADGPKVRIGFEGSFGAHLVSPRTLTSDFMTRLVCVEGIVTKASLVRPKVAKSVHYCPETGQFTLKAYRDATHLTGHPTGSSYPTRDADGNALETEFGLSEYHDHQTFTLQEMPERAPLGQLPRSVDVMLDDDLVDHVKPGDRVQVVGIYRALAGTSGGATSGVFRTTVICNSIKILGKEVNGVTVSPEDITEIRKLSKRKDIFDLLARSLAPSIYGHTYIKKALLMLLVGGVERNLANNTHLRGDINILMVGDPSTAKSQMLRFVLGMAPLAVNTTGRGSSGVGLTAAVTTDAETGERRLEAGAMVLADRGIVCIDEFDKMSDADRVAIHEVMEQQTVTIAKAGIQASLNARCSVVAAANPIYGQYDPSLTPQKNVHLPDSLLSRFDLLFIVQDHMDEAKDSNIAGHILRMHRYVRPGQEGIPIPLDAVGASKEDAEDDAADPDAPVMPFEKFQPLLHGGAAAAAEEEGDDGIVELLKMEFVKKYIHYAKKRSPPMTESARELICTNYTDLRQRQADGRIMMPVTPRALETIIRLASASAKLRLGKNVTDADVTTAFELMTSALEYDSAAVLAAAKAKKKARGEKRLRDAGGGGHDDDDDDGDGDDEEGGGDVPEGDDQEAELGGSGDDGDDSGPKRAPASSPKKRASLFQRSPRAGAGASAGATNPKAKRVRTSPPEEEEEEEEDIDLGSDADEAGDDDLVAEPVDDKDPEYIAFMKLLVKNMRAHRTRSFTLTTALEWGREAGMVISRARGHSLGTKLHERNRVYYQHQMFHQL